MQTKSSTSDLYAKVKQRIFNALEQGVHYAVEELVAELRAPFVCAELQIGTEPMDGHASYLATWLQVLKAESRALFAAAAQTQQAADYLRQFQGSKA